MSDGSPFDFEGDPSTFEGAPESTATVYNIVEAELPSVIIKANSGELEAVLRLYKYFRYVENNDAEAFRWLLISAQIGDVTSQYNLALDYLNKNNFKEARLWATKAINNRDQEASSLLEQIKEKEKAVK